MMHTIDPACVPYRTLPTGDQIPAIGIGTFGSDKYRPHEIAHAVQDAAALGYRHFDCAAVYGNEKEIGAALHHVIASGIPREELFITSKLWNDKHAEADVIPAFRRSLTDLGLEYLDLYLIHWPFPNYHAPGVDVTARDPHALPYTHADYLTVWRKLEQLMDDGLVRNIGTSNMTVPKLELLLRDARIKPAVNEMELHPHFQQPELFRYVVENGIQPIGYSPLGSPSRPVRDTTPDDTVDMDDPVIQALAHERGVSPASICIQWAIQRGQIPIPFSVKRHQYLASLQAAVDSQEKPLSNAEMTAITGIDRNCRLIKGQVFLWEGAPGWESLWDLDGTIAD